MNWILQRLSALLSVEALSFYNDTFFFRIWCFGWDICHFEYLIFQYNFKNTCLWVGSMVLLVKTLATKLKDLSSIPQTHRVEEESGFPQIISSNFDTNTHACIHTYTCTYKMNFVLHTYFCFCGFIYHYFYGLFLLYDALFYISTVDSFE